jgi:hypothetical protein
MTLEEILSRLRVALPFMDRETLEKLLALVREYKAKLQEGGLPASTVEEMTKAVDDRLMADIVRDQRRGVSPPGWFPPETSAPVGRGTGWASPPKTEDRSMQTKLFDQMVEALAGGPNDTSKLR